MTNKARLFNSGIYYQASGIHPETGDWVVATLYHGECSQVLQEEDIRPTACVTDPPYGLEFMGKDWDKFSPAKPKRRSAAGDSTVGSFSDKEKGGYGTPTYVARRKTYTCKSCGKRDKFKNPHKCKNPEWEYGFVDKQPLEMMAFQGWATQVFGAVQDCLPPGGFVFAFGGTRVYHRLVCGLEDAGFEIRDCLMWLYGQGFPKSHNIHKATKDDAWKGYGSALKPAYEAIVVAMKPNDGSFANNALKHGVAGLNIDECRIGFEDTPNPATNPLYRYQNDYKQVTDHGQKPGVNTPFTNSLNPPSKDGRFPANVILDEGITDEPWSRFFYCPKPSKKERGEANNHPTVKPINLMAYLVRMVKMPSGTVVLDPFNGSGTTGLACLKEGVDYIGIELSADYLEITKARLEAILKEWEPVLTTSNNEPIVSEK